MEQPKISVIIPVYNTEKYLEQCLDSIINQTLKEIEIICIDNGSTDKSSGILERYSKIDKRLKVIKEEKNRGTAYVRNKGINMAIGEYLSILDSDDFFELDMLESTYNLANEKKLDVVVFDGWYYSDVYHTNRGVDFILNKKFAPKDKEVFSYKDIPEKIFNFTGTAVWNKLYRSEFVKENNIKFFDEYNGEYCADDVFFESIALVLAERISVLHKKLLHYRIDNGESQESKTINYYMKNYLAIISVKEELKKIKIFDYIEKSFNNLAIYLCLNILERITEPLIFEDVYNFLKERFIIEFDILTKSEDYFYNYYNFIQLKQISKYSASAYLFNQIKFINKSYVSFYPFPFNKYTTNKNIIIYGAGKVGISYIKQIKCSNSSINLVLWVDKEYKKLQSINNIKISNPEEVLNKDYDSIVIAMIDKKIALSIKQYLIDLKVPANKIIWPIDE